MLKPALFASAFVVGVMLLFGCFGQAYALPLGQRPTIGLADRASGLAVKIKFDCSWIEGMLVCGKKNKTDDQPSTDEAPQAVEQPCPTGMIGKQPNCECPDGTYFAAFVGCVPVIPTAPAPGTPTSGGAPKHYCITCGGPGCLQKAPECPSGGLTTCTDVPGQTYYNCCCN
jgi:hypothetical protein